MITNNLDILMKTNNITTTQLAKKIGISRISINAIRKNKTQGISYSTLNALCKFFKCDVGQILEKR